MKINKKLFVLLWFLMQGMLYASAIDKTEGYRVALNFVNAFLVQKDVKKSLAYVSKDAVFRKQKKGSAIKQIRQAEGMGHITLHEIMFFDKNTLTEQLAQLSKRYPVTKKEDSEYMPLYIRSLMSEKSVGCFVTADIVSKKGKRSTLVALFIFNEKDGQYRLVYMKDIV